MKPKRKRFVRPENKAWKAAHPEFTRVQSSPVYAKDQLRTLFCANEFLSGSADFRKQNGMWWCIRAHEDVKFLRALDPISAKIELIRRGFHWQWDQPLSTSSQGNSGEARTPKPQLQQQGTPRNKLKDTNLREQVTNAPSLTAGEQRDTGVCVACSTGLVNNAAPTGEGKQTTSEASVATFNGSPLSHTAGADSRSQKVNDTEPSDHTRQSVYKDVQSSRPSKASMRISSP